eukprot:scaffold55631_cov52-Attheya_sp.AAC.3
MLNMTIADIKEAATGTITGANTPTTWDNKKHPVNQWINADVDQREKIVNNTGVCGMCFFTSNNRFKIIQGVAMVFSRPYPRLSKAVRRQHAIGPILPPPIDTE